MKSSIFGRYCSHGAKVHGEGEAPSELVRGWLQRLALPSKPVRLSTPAGSSDGASPSHAYRGTALP